MIFIPWLNFNRYKQTEYNLILFRIFIKIKMMNARINEILSDLKNHLIHHYGDSVKDVVLFGSQARGDSNKFSDYDVLII